MILKRFTGTAKEFLEQHYEVDLTDVEVENSAQGVIEYLKTHNILDEEDLLMSDVFWDYPLAEKYQAINAHYISYDDTLSLWVFDNHIFETKEYYNPTKVNHKKEYYDLLDQLRLCYDLLGKSGKDTKSFVRDTIKNIIDESEETEI